MTTSNQTRPASDGEVSASGAELVRALRNMVHALDAAQSDMADIFAPKIARNRATAVALLAKLSGPSS